MTKGPILKSRISLVTISYNQAEFLEETIRSVLSQDYDNLEYIVADGGSTDGSDQIIEKYRHRIAAAFCGPDGGPARALNNAFAHAHGEVLGFLNSDDTLLPGAIERVMTFLHQNPSVDFVSGHCLVTDAKGNILRKTYSDPLCTRALIYDACIMLQPATFFRKSLFDRSPGFKESNRISWDWELFVEFALLKANHAVLDHLLASYRLHDASITGRDHDDDIRQNIRDRVIQRCLGRPPRFYDKLIRYYYRYRRKLFNPRDTIERILRGPIGGRFSDPA